MAVGIHQGHAPAGGIVDLGRPETIGVEHARDPAGRVIDRGRDVRVGVLDADGPAGDVERRGRAVEQRVDAGHRPQQLVEHTRRDEAQRVGRPDRIVREVIAEAGAVAQGIDRRRQAVGRVEHAGRDIPSGFVVRIRFQDASYAKLVRFPSGSIWATTRLARSKTLVLI